MYYWTQLETERGNVHPLERIYNLIGPQYDIDRFFLDTGMPYPVVRPVSFPTGVADNGCQSSRVVERLMIVVSNLTIPDRSIIF